MKMISDIKPHPPNSETLSRALICLCLVALALTLTACNEKTSGYTPPPSSPVSSNPEAAKEGARIMQQYLALDTAKEVAMKMTVKIQDEGGQSRELQMNLAKKRQADGSRLILIEFTAPAEERDRNALLTITPQGDIEGTRYIQSNDSFATVKGAV